MGPTVRAIMDLPIFRDAGVRVAAGARNLHRAVRWVHAGEIPDIHRFLSGGEMLLTAGLGIGRDEREQRDYVRRIATAGAAVLVVELAGRAFSEMPAAVAEEAERHGLPLIGLREEIPFAEVSALVHEMLVGQRLQELSAEEAVSEVFMNLLLDGADHLSLTTELARRVGHPVVLEDMAHQVLAYSGPTIDGDRVVADWNTHSRLVHESQERQAQEHEPGGCTRRPVVLRGERWGWLHVLHGRDLPAGPALYALERTAAAVAITLLGERASGARAAQRQAALVNRLMLGDVSGEDFVAKALRLGRDLRGRKLLVAVVNKSGADGPFGDRELDAALRGAGFPTVVADIGDHALAVVGLPAAAAEQRVADALSGHRVRAGLSRVTGPAPLHTSVQQARSAAAAADRGPAAEVRRFDDLGVLRLLTVLAEGPELAGYVEDELGPLLRHDAGSANRLLPTLRAYLEFDGNKSRAAESLYVQRRTLYYRLARISALLDVSLDEPEVRQRLLLAVRGLDLLQRPAGTG